MISTPFCQVIYYSQSLTLSVSACLSVSQQKQKKCFFLSSLDRTGGFFGGDDTQLGCLPNTGLRFLIDPPFPKIRP